MSDLFCPLGLDCEAMGYDPEWGECDNATACMSWVKACPLPSSEWFTDDGTHKLVVCFDAMKWDGGGYGIETEEGMESGGGYSEEQMDTLTDQLKKAGWAEAIEFPYELGIGYHLGHHAETGRDWLLVKPRTPPELQKEGWAEAIELPYEWKYWPSMCSKPILFVTDNRPEGFFPACDIPYVYYHPEDAISEVDCPTLKVLEGTVTANTAVMSVGWCSPVRLDWWYRNI